MGAFYYIKKPPLRQQERFSWKLCRPGGRYNLSLDKKIIPQSSGTCIGAIFVLFFIQFYMEDDIL